MRSQQRHSENVKFPFRVVVMVVVFQISFAIVSAIIYGMIEDWSLTDSLYFTVISITTVGYGDLRPSSTGGEIANLVLTLVSFCVLFVLARLIISHTVDRQLDAIINRIKEKKKKKRRAIPLWRDLTKEQTDLQKLADDAQEEIEEEEETKITSGRDLRIFIHTGVYLIWLVVWTLCFTLYEDEDKTIFEALYGGIITSTTIGYGEFRPNTKTGKWFCIGLTVFGVIALSLLASAIARWISAAMPKIKCFGMKRADPEKTAQKSQREALESLLDLVKKGEHTMTEAEFLCAMLVAAKKVTKEEMAKLSKDFRELDADGNGVLSEEDFITYKQRTLLGDDDVAGMDYHTSEQTIAMTKVGNGAQMVHRSHNSSDIDQSE